MSPFHKSHLNSTLPATFAPSRFHFFVVKNISLWTPLLLPPPPCHSPWAPLWFSLSAACLLILQTATQRANYTANLSLYEQIIGWTFFSYISNIVFRWIHKPLYICIRYWNVVHLWYDDVMVWLITYLLLNWSTWHWKPFAWTDTNEVFWADMRQYIFMYLLK